MRSAVRLSKRHCRKQELKKPGGLLDHDARMLAIADADADADANADADADADAEALESLRWWEHEGWFPVLQSFRAHNYGFDRDGVFLLVRAGLVAESRRPTHPPYFSRVLESCPQHCQVRDVGDDDEAMVVWFHEHSACSSLDMMSQRPTWQGTCAQLLEMARGCRDPAFPRRRLDPADQGYELWAELWAAVVAWAAVGCPRWRGRLQVGRTKGRLWQAGKVPEARQVVAEHASAARIQAAFRGWTWRRKVLWNPITAVGAARLRRLADTWVSTG